MSTVIGEYDLAADLARMSADAARAFPIWLGLPDRSWATLAATTGDNENTVRTWASRYRWKEAAARYDASAAAALLGAMRSTLIVEGLRSVKTAIEVRDNPKSRDSDRLKAAFWIAGLSGIGSQLAADDGLTGGGIRADDLRRMATSGKPDDLRRLVELTTGRGE